MDKVREFVIQHWKDVLTVAVFTLAVFLVGKLLLLRYPAGQLIDLRHCAINRALAAQLLVLR